MKNELSRRISIRTAAAVLVAAASVSGQANAVHAESDAIHRIEKYCQKSWHNARIPTAEWDECTQEAFTELLGRIPRANLPDAAENVESSERRELMRSVWCTIQRWRRAPKHQQLAHEEIHDDRVTRKEPVADLQEIRDVIAASQSGLSSRQQIILTEWVDGASISEISDDLQIPASRVSDEKYKAIKKLQKLLV